MKSPDELIHKIFSALQAKDEDAFLSLCPDSVQLVHVMKRLAEGVIADIKSGLPKNFSRSSMAILDKSLESVRASLRKTYSPKEIQKLRNGFKESFHHIIEDGEKGGVDWPAATFTAYSFDSAKGANFLYNQNLFDSSSFRSMSGKIYFKDKDSTCQIWFREMLFSSAEKNWFAGELEILALPGMEVRDVVMQNIQDEPPPPPPPPPPYKRKKSKSSSAKKKRSTTL